MGDDLQPVLESVDRELAFYRRRVGQVLFIGLVVEAAILTSAQKIKLEAAPEWQRACVETFLFCAVAAAGIALGCEYSRRIGYLKKRRVKLIPPEYGEVFPRPKAHLVSEIGTLVFALFSLSSAGTFIAWLDAYPSTTLFVVFVVCIVAVLVVFGTYCLMGPRRLARRLNSVAE